MMRVEVEEDFGRPSGHAVIRVVGGAASSARGDPRFRLRRAAEWGNATLGPSGWQAADALLEPTSVSVDGDNLLLGAGPAICRHLDSGVYEFVIPSASLETVVSWPDIAMPVAAPPPPPPPPPPPRPSPPTPPPPPPTTTTTTTVTPPKPPVGAALKWPLWTIVAVAVLAAGGAGYAVYRGRSGPTPCADCSLAPPPPPPAPCADCGANLDSMSAREIIARKNPAEMVAQAERRIGKAPQGPQDALLLLEAAGDDSSYGPALGLLAQLFDPNKPRRGGIAADARQAARYYKAAVAAGQTALSADREALRVTLAGRTNDLNAPLILKDFWP